MKKLFESRKLSRYDAVLIAESQNDLGGMSQKDMRIALSGNKAETPKEFLKERQKAFDQLDPLSQMIVKEFLGNGTIQEAVSSLEYAAHNIKKAIEAMKISHE